MEASLYNVEHSSYDDQLSFNSGTEIRRRQFGPFDKIMKSNNMRAIQVETITKVVLCLGNTMSRSMYQISRSSGTKQCTVHVLCKT